MGIPFTQFLLPDGRQRDTAIERPEDIEAIARSFIDAGGWFECEVLTTGHVSLTACAEVDGEAQDVDIRVCANGPGVEGAVDELVCAAPAALSRARALVSS